METSWSLKNWKIHLQFLCIIIIIINIIIIVIIISIIIAIIIIISTTILIVIIIIVIIISIICVTMILTPNCKLNWTLTWRLLDCRPDIGPAIWHQAPTLISTAARLTSDRQTDIRPPFLHHSATPTSMDVREGMSGTSADVPGLWSWNGVCLSFKWKMRAKIIFVQKY